MRYVMVLLGLMVLLSGITGGWAMRLEGEESKAYAPPPEIGDSVYIFQCYYQDDTGVPITYFHPPENVTPATSRQGVNDVAFRVVRDENGNAHVVWMSDEYGAWEVFYEVIAPDGAIIIQETLVSMVDGENSGYPAIAVEPLVGDIANAHIVWMDYRENEWEIYYSKVRSNLSPPHGELATDLTDPDVRISDPLHASGRWVDPLSEYEIWAEPRSGLGNPILAVHTYFLEHPDIDIDPGKDLHIVWSDYRDGFWNVYYQKQTNDAIPEPLINDMRVSFPPTGYDAHSPAIAVGPIVGEPGDYYNGVHITWMEWYDSYWTEWRIYYRKQRNTDGSVVIGNTPVSGDPDGFHSASPDIGADTTDYVAIAFMDNRPVDPGHGDEIHPEKNDIHIDGYWEIYVVTLNTAGGTAQVYRDPKRESDLQQTVEIPGNWPPWGDPVFGYYIGPGSPYNLTDGPSMYPRIVTTGNFAARTTQVTWQDSRDWNWEVYWTKFSSWCKNPNEDIQLTNDPRPDKYPDLASDVNEDPDVKWQKKVEEGDWNGYDSRWKGDEFVKLRIASAAGEETYFTYRADPTDSDPSDSILYIWTMPLEPATYNWRFEVRNYLNETAQTEWHEMAVKGGRTEVPSEEEGSFINEGLWLGDYPNPSRLHTTICYTLPVEENVRLRVYDVTGRLVRTLVNERSSPGRHKIVWDARDDLGKDVPSGIYFYRIEAGRVSKTRKIALVR